jgi:hypothetical protein
MNTDTLLPELSRLSNIWSDYGRRCGLDGRVQGHDQAYWYGLASTAFDYYYGWQYGETA